MSIDNKEKARREIHKGRTTTEEIENIMINIEEYCETVDEKTEPIEEIMVDLRADHKKARQISTHFFKTIEELKKKFSKQDPKKSKLNS